MTRLPLTLAALVAVSAAMPLGARADEGRPLYEPLDSTYSIIAFDPETGELGHGVQSKAFAAGNRTVTGKGGVAIIAHQSSSNPMYGRLGIELIELGMSPQMAMDFMLRADEQPERRQSAIIDIHGNTAAWTSPEISAWAGHHCGVNFCAQGNTLTGANVVEDMAAVYESATGPLAERLLAALDAAEAAGGDARGMQGAALYIVKPLVRANYDDTVIDLRVDDHPEPLAELRRLLDMFRASAMLGDVTAKVQAGDLPAAMEVATTAYEMAPALDLTVLAVAEVSLRMGNTEAALAAVEEAIGLNPKLKPRLIADEAFASLRENPTFMALTTQ